MWIHFAVLVLTLVYTLYRYFTRTFNYWKDRNVVGPDPWPLFGNTFHLTTQRKFIGTCFKEFYEKYPNEKVVGVYRMTKPVLLLRDLDIIKHILIKDFDNFADRGFDLSDEGLGANLFTAVEDTWRVLRAKFAPMFTSGKLKKMLPLILERADRFLEDFEIMHDETSELNAQAVTRHFTVSSIAACAFGLDLQYNDSNMTILRNIDKLVLEVSYFSEFVLLHPKLIRKFNEVLFSTQIENFFSQLVKTVFEQRNFKPSSRNDFMDIILEMKSEKVVRKVIDKRADDSDVDLSVELTDAMVAAQAFTFFVAGFENTATTVGYLLNELAKHRQVQDKFLEEIDRMLAKTDGEIEYDALMDMPYMSKVFDETLRKYPLVDPLIRAAKVDYKVPNTNLTIKKGQQVLISADGIQHDEKYYPNPQVFDPERFSPEEVVSRHSCAYLPFGNGPRNCMGMRFAKVQSRVFLVKLMSKYRVETTKNTPEKLLKNPARATGGPHKPIILNFVRR